MTLRDHFELIYRDLAATLRDFQCGTRQTRQALKTASACVLSILVVYALDLKEAYWAGITTIIMMRPNVAASIQKGWMRAGGACLGCFLAVILTGIFLQQHLVYTLAFFVLSILGFYLGVTARNGYFWSYFIMNGVLISMVGMTDPSITVYITVHRGAAITVGVLVSLMFNVIFFPDFAYEALRKEFTDHRKNTFLWIREIIRQYMTNDYRPNEIDADYGALIKTSGKIEGLLKDVATEKKLIKGDPDILAVLFSRLKRRIEDFYAFFQGLLVIDLEPAYPENHKPELENLLEKLNLLGEGAQWSLAKQNPVFEDMEKILNRLEYHYEQSIPRVRKEDYGILQILNFLEMINILRRMVNDLTFHTREESINEVAEGSEGIFDDEDSDLYRFSFLGRIRTLHIPSFKYAVKGSLGIVCVFWFWLWAEIPGPALNVSVAVITVLQQDLMSTTHKGLLRFLGCLWGAAAGYAFLGFQVESTLVLCVSLFMVVFFFAFIWGGRSGCAYLGCQAGLCYMVATIHDLASMTSLAPPTERLVGIFLGVLFTWGINLLVWPEDLLARFKDRLRYSKTRLAAIGEEIAARFRGYDVLKPAALDVPALQSTLQTLLNQMEIPAGDAVVIRSWLHQMRLLAEESAGMGTVDKETARLLTELNPDFVPLLVETLFLLSEARSREDFDCILKRLEEREGEFNEILIKLRGGVIVSKPLDFKQRFAHTLVASKRLIQRLKSLAQTGRRLRDVIDLISDSESDKRKAC